jgi:hypothetical protein
MIPPKIEHYQSLKSTKFPLLARIDIHQIWSDNEIPPDLQVELEMRSRQVGSHEALILQFLGVRELRFSQPSLSLLQITLLEISSIKDRGWETLRYKVKDEEDGNLSFFCADFHADIKTID